jgi:hypothetical protein
MQPQDRILEAQNHHRPPARMSAGSLEHCQWMECVAGTILQAGLVRTLLTE